MTQLVEALFPAPDYRRTTLSLLQWWESRRLLYNGLVGATGLVTLSVVDLLGVLPPNPHALVPWQGVAAFAVGANVFYTLGWIVESAMERAWKRQAPLIGPALFRQGVAFAVGLTLLPIPLAVLGWVARVVQALT
jgi:hypothetical protein